MTCRRFVLLLQPTTRRKKIINHGAPAASSFVFLLNPFTNKKSEPPLVKDRENNQSFGRLDIDEMASVCRLHEQQHIFPPSSSPPIPPRDSAAHTPRREVTTRCVTVLSRSKTQQPPRITTMAHIALKSSSSIYSCTTCDVIVSTLRP